MSPNNLGSLGQPPGLHHIRGALPPELETVERALHRALRQLQADHLQACEPILAALHGLDRYRAPDRLFFVEVNPHER